MGGGLGFLNKKTWHPGRQSNQERLWKAEGDAAAEQRSLAELRKKIEEERGREELKQAAIAGGHQKCAPHTGMHPDALFPRGAARAAFFLRSPRSSGDPNESMQRCCRFCFTLSCI